MFIIIIILSLPHSPSPLLPLKKGDFTSILGYFISGLYLHLLRTTHTIVSLVPPRHTIHSWRSNPPGCFLRAHPIFLKGPIQSLPVSNPPLRIPSGSVLFFSFCHNIIFSFGFNLPWVSLTAKCSRSGGQPPNTPPS